jgi:hypothetical protein
MRRRALKVLTFCSFILAVVIGGVWLRSYVQHDLFLRRQKNEAYYQEYIFGWSRGRVIASYAHRQADPQDVPAVVSAAAPRYDWDVEDPVILRSGRSAMNGYGFTLVGNTTYYPPTHLERGATWTRVGFVLPCWVIFGLSMLLPAIAWQGRGRRKATDVPDGTPR